MTYVSTWEGIVRGCYGRFGMEQVKVACIFLHLDANLYSIGNRGHVCTTYNSGGRSANG
jgi:hypothetical protein